jgi:hypothetical protein
MKFRGPQAPNDTLVTHDKKISRPLAQFMVPYGPRNDYLKQIESEQ